MELTLQASSSSSSTSKYVKEFESLFIPVRKQLLRERARDGNLRHCQFRSICWRYFLHCLPENHAEWIESCQRDREKYEKIKSNHLLVKSTVKGDSKAAINSCLPQTGQQEPSKTQLNSQILQADRQPNNNKSSEELDDEQQYKKAASNCDHKDLFKTIQRDVVRTFPDMEFFRRSEMQSILENVLFNYASENVHISYKQGMHELLATLLYVLHTDSQNCLINYEGGYANDFIATLLSLKYLEHDAFHTFCALMKSIESWYQNDEILIVPASFDTTTNKINSNRPSRQVSSVLSIKLRIISESIVKSFDPELFNHLEALQIAPQIYGIRWMRLLFGREFEFLDLLTVWDAIICDKITMSLTDYIFASMLITIREELVNGDYTECLNNLMRYQFKDVQYVIKLALHLRNPDTNDRPKSSRIGFKSHRPIPINYKSQRRVVSGTSLTDKLRQQYLQPASSSSSTKKSQTANRFAMSTIAATGTALKLSNESYDDLHSIVDYCWRLLSEQIDSLQRCLPKEKSLHSEDEIFVALAQLKKVRDVLKGSLRLEDELESPP